MPNRKQELSNDLHGEAMSHLSSPTSVSEFRPVSEAETSEVFSSQAEIEKARSVQECLECDPVSLWDLRELALSEGGLVNGTCSDFQDETKLFRLSS